MITIREYKRPESLEEAYELNKKKSSRIIAGMLWTKMSRGSVGTAIDLSGLGLDRIEEDAQSFSIGAMVSLRELELHAAFNAYCGGIAQKALAPIVGVQFRNLATVGGSIWGRYGFSDVLTLLLSMDSYVELYKGGTVSLSDFAAMKPDRDILVRIIVKKNNSRFAYNAMRIQSTDLPVLTCAVSETDGKYRAVIGARPGRAVTVEADREKLAYEAGRLPFGSNLRGSAEYRRHLAKVLTERGLEELTSDNI